MFVEIKITAKVGTGELSTKLNELGAYKNFILIKSNGDEYYFLCETKFGDQYSEIYEIQPEVAEIIG